jgi:hypothetical protein
MQQELYGIYPMWHVPFWQTTTFYVLMALSIGGALLIALIVWIKHVRARKQQLMIWDKSLQELHDLRNQYGIAQAKEFYAVLSLILKKYLHGRFGYDVYSKTDQELLQYLATTSFPRELIEQLHSIIEGSVLVKFANAQAIQEQMQHDFNTSISIITKTIPPRTK